MATTKAKLAIAVACQFTITRHEGTGTFWDLPYEAFPVKEPSWAEMNRGKLSKRERRK